MRSWLCTGLCLFAAAALAAAGIGPEPMAAPEGELKAALLVTMMNFVTWPEGAFESTNAPMRVGVIGRHSFGEALDRLAAKRTVEGRSLKVAYAEDAAGLAGCEAVFVARERRETVAAIAEAFRGKPVLLIGEEDGFAKAGGMISLLVRDDRPFLQINVGAVEASGLKLRGQLAQTKRIEWIGRPTP